MNDFKDISQKLGILIGEVRGMKEQLEKLNGKVAQHEKRLNHFDRDKDDADKVHDDMQPMVDLYKSFGSIKSMAIGVASVFSAVGVIVIGLAWAVKKLMGL